ncbi:MAG: helix-turn-helix transcriptional regulator [Ahrensia sp.]
MSRIEDGENNFGERLRDAREARSLNQTELARLANLQPAAIGHFENNRRKPSFANIRALARALNVASDYLLGRTAVMSGATTAFRNEENLSDSDRESIQMMIDTLAQRRKDRTE